MSRSKSWIELEVGLSGPLSKTVLKAMAGLFERSSRDQLDWLMETLELRAYRPGAVLCSEGETAQELYVICSGRCGIYTQESDGRLRLIDSVDQVGMLLGEQVFRQDRGFRSATILTLSDCEIGAISGERFRELLLKDHSANKTLEVWAARNVRNKLVALPRRWAISRNGI
jgi:CRP-like cAMP-binding protein